ncbi:hypothetical protein QTO34_014760 [Cnephaeus nilssonii]|uniref:FAM86 N-terminal domain-containing protein n=1 Tax=Cnephaeus nilssonii TaxID=3371016 RepID=A0AA40I7Z3_CNENI|nr:hypothetical protein QTO34_014760 [Eptesicus nilssonii]
MAPEESVEALCLLQSFERRFLAVCTLRSFPWQSVEASEVKHVPAASGPVSVAADLPNNEKEIDPSSIPTAIKYQDDNSLAHPNLFIEKADAEEKWFKRLIALRQERLMGSPVA